MCVVRAIVMVTDREVVTEALVELSARRPLFHDEADLVRALALAIHKLRPQFEIPRIEVTHVLPGKQKLDILAKLDRSRIAIEMKYVRASLNRGNPFRLSGEWYWPSSTSQPDDRTRFKFWEDVERLESVTEESQDLVGYAILLTNKESLWNPPETDKPHDSMFRIDSGKKHGTLRWGKGTSLTTIKEFGESVIIRGYYSVKWKHYSWIPGNKHDEFKYALVHVT